METKRSPGVFNANAIIKTGEFELYRFNEKQVSQLQIASIPQLVKESTKCFICPEDRGCTFRSTCKFSFFKHIRELEIALSQVLVCAVGERSKASKTPTKDNVSKVSKSPTKATKATPKKRGRPAKATLNQSTLSNGDTKPNKPAKAKTAKANTSIGGEVAAGPAVVKPKKTLRTKTAAGAPAAAAVAKQKTTKAESATNSPAPKRGRPKKSSAADAKKSPAAKPIVKKTAKPSAKLTAKSPAAKPTAKPAAKKVAKSSVVKTESVPKSPAAKRGRPKKDASAPVAKKSSIAQKSAAGKVPTKAALKATAPLSFTNSRRILSASERKRWVEVQRLSQVQTPIRRVSGGRFEAGGTFRRIDKRKSLLDSVPILNLMSPVVRMVGSLFPSISK